MKIETLLSEYWDLAYAEGAETRDHDTKDGDAQRVLLEITTLFERLTAGKKLICKDLFFCDSQWRERFLRVTAERDELVKNNDELELEILQKILAVSAMEDRLEALESDCDKLATAVNKVKCTLNVIDLNRQHNVETHLRRVDRCISVLNELSVDTHDQLTKQAENE
jgi:hypothetical protein